MKKKLNLQANQAITYILLIITHIKSSQQPFQRHDYAQEQQSREPPQEIPSRNLQNQPNFSEYEPVMNRNQPQNAFTEEPMRGQKVNFNPSYQPSMDYHEPVVGRESRELGNGKFDDRKKKNDYAEELRNQMRQKEMQKQQEKNQIRSSMQRNNSNIEYESSFKE